MFESGRRDGPTARELGHRLLEVLANGVTLFRRRSPFANGRVVVCAEREKLGENVMKRVAAGFIAESLAFEPAKRPDVRAGYCLSGPIRHLLTP